jgi:hypothetical protein
MASSTSLCAFDATFAAGLLDAAVQALSSGQPCLLIAFDTAYPQPLQALRPIPYAMGVGLLLNPQRTAAARATLAITLSQDAATVMPDPALEALRLRIPAARSLPLLQHLARGSHGTVVIDYSILDCRAFPHHQHACRLTRVEQWDADIVAAPVPPPPDNLGAPPIGWVLPTASNSAPGDGGAWPLWQPTTQRPRSASDQRARCAVAAPPPG